MSEKPVCSICGEPMEEIESMFKFHGSIGPCPKPPLKKPEQRYRRSFESIQECQDFYCRELTAARAECEQMMRTDYWHEKYQSLKANEQKLVAFLEKLANADHPSAADKTSWIIMCESICLEARRILKAHKGGA